MYLPERFEERDDDAVFDLVRENGFGLLITSHHDGPQATHIPLLLDPGVGQRGTLFGHVARNNPHWTRIDPSCSALVVFQGPHAYVSPTWYADTSRVPTWNYTAVHVSGCVEVVRDREGLLDIVTRLVEFYEAGRQPRWRVEDAANLERMLDAIVGLKVTIDTIQAKFKLSQDRGAADQRGVIDALSASPHSAARGVAELMRRKAKAQS